MEIHWNSPISENSSPHVWSPPLSCSFRCTVPCVSSLALTPESQVRVEQVRFFENSVPLKPLVNPPVSYNKNSHLKGVNAFFWDTPIAHMYHTFLNSTFSGTPHIWLVNPWFPIDIPLNPVIHWWSSGIVPFPDCPMTKSGWKSEIEVDTP